MGGGEYIHTHATVNDVLPQEPSILSGSLIDLELTS